jgi:hypothetical protein
LQGLFILPLAFYLIFLLLQNKKNKIFLIFILGGSALFLIKQTFELNSQSCNEYPGIQNAINKVTTNFSSSNLLEFPKWLNTHITNYANMFIYKKSFSVGYLPGILISNSFYSFFLAFLNIIIFCIVIFNLFIFIYLVVLSLFNFFKMYKNKKKISQLNIVAVLFGFPTIFLFFYDNAQNFYRCFYINTIISLFLAVFFTENNLSRYSNFFKKYLMSCLFILVVTSFLNYKIFYKAFSAGFEGPSVSVFNDFKKINSDINTLVLKSGIDLSRGSIVTDDLTFEALKNYPHILPITYLSLTGGYAGLNSHDVINIIGANSIIARCDYINAWGKFKISHKNDKICAINLLEGK